MPPTAPSPQIYGWPFGLTPMWRNFVDPYKDAAAARLQAAAAKLDCRRCWRQRQSQKRTLTSLPFSAVASDLVVGRPSSEAGQEKEDGSVHV